MRYLQRTCPQCKTVDRIDAAIVLVCPTCAAPAGSPCVDRRGVRYRELVSSHQERRRLMDETNDAARRQLTTAS